MLRFSLFGFPVAIHWMFWLIIAYIGGGLEAKTPEQMQRLVLWIAAALVSLLIHELGHTFMMRKYGARASIMLYTFGGRAIPDRGFTRTQQILVSLAGPLVQIAFGCAVYALLRMGDAPGSKLGAWLPYYLLHSFFIISVVWGLLNLVPIYPLDGGHVMNSILGPSFYKMTMWIGAILAVAIGIYIYDRTQSIYNMLIFGMLAWQNAQRATGAQPSTFLQPN